MPFPRPMVLIPTKDNVGTIADVVRASLVHTPHVVVVDDGSVDGSGDRAREAGATVLTHTENHGKGAALLTGMRYASSLGYTHIIALDADGQHIPDDIPAFVAAIEREPGAIYAGVRDLSTAPTASRKGRAFSNWWIWFETGVRVADSQCGFRAYPIRPVLALKLGGSRYDMEVEVLTRAIWAGTPVRDLPCQVYYPTPEERVSSFSPLWDNVRISVMNTKLVTERLLWPPRWVKRVGPPPASLLPAPKPDAPEAASGPPPPSPTPPTRPQSPVPATAHGMGDTAAHRPDGASGCSSCGGSADGQRTQACG